MKHKWKKTDDPPSWMGTYKPKRAYTFECMQCHSVIVTTETGKIPSKVWKDQGIPECDVAVIQGVLEG